MAVIYGPTGRPQLNSLFNDIYEGVLTIAEEEALMPRLVKIFNDTDSAEDRVFSKRPKFVMDDVNEEDDYQAAQQFGKSEIARITPGEKMAQAYLKWRAMRQDPTILADAKTAMGVAMARKIDQDLMALFPSLTGGEGSVIGGEDVAATWGHITAGQTQLSNGDVGGQYACVLHNYSIHPLSKALDLVSDKASVPEYIQSALGSKWYVGSYQNTHFFGTNKLPVVSGTATGALFAMGDCLAYDERVAPNPLLEDDASDRATEVNWHADYGVGVMRPDHGIPMKFAAVAPTS